MAKNYVVLNEKWEEDKYTAKAASTVFQNGGFISYNGSGGVIPSTAGLPIMGVGQEDVTSSDVDYTSTRKIAYQTVGPNTYFVIPVTAGTATAAMVGKIFNLDTPESLSVSAYSTLTYNTLAVSTFAVAETITGGTSAATGVITVTQTVGGVQKLVFTVTSGTFVAGETITGGTSSATAKILEVFTGGTQVEITKYISATQVEGKAVLIA